MDCPSCAAKIEKAVSQLPGIKDAKVRFATEKLVVNYTEPASSVAIEKVIVATGFSLTRDESKMSKQSPLVQLIQQNLQIFSIAFAMVIAAAIKPLYLNLAIGYLLLPA